MSLYQRIKNIPKIIKIGVLTGLAALVINCGQKDVHVHIPTDYKQDTITQENQAPEITNILANPSTVNIGETSIIYCAANDADNDVLTYDWNITEPTPPSAGHGGGSADGSCGGGGTNNYNLYCCGDCSTIAFTPTAYGDFSIECIVSDGELSDFDNINLSIYEELPINNPPVLSNLPDIVMDEDTTFTSDLNNYVSDHENDPITWGVSGNTNINVNIDPVTYVATLSAPVDWYGQENLTLYACDPSNDCGNDTFLVTVNPISEPVTYHCSDLIDNDGDTFMDYPDDIGCIDEFDNDETNPLLVEKILFTSNRNGNFDLYTINPDGSNLEQITDTSWDEYTSDWSPDGTKIVYQSTEGSDPDSQQWIYNIFTINRDGTGKTQLTFDGVYNGIPSWSPNGDKITFVSTRNGNNDIYVMGADGGNVIQLTNSQNLDTARSWSPDGSRIAFSSTRDGDYEIYTMDADGSNVIQLTNNNVDDLYPKFSPDGSRIAFMSYIAEDGDVDIYVMGADGSNVERITTSTRGDNPSSIGNWAANWSPDGQYFVFTSDRDRVADESFAELYTMKTDGTEQTRLTFNGKDWAPVWISYTE